MVFNERSATLEKIERFPLLVHKFKKKLIYQDNSF
jgi:hypothetical protein